MSMPRDPLFRVGDPAHNLIPPAGGAIWYPLHDSLLAAGVPNLPTLVELGTPHGSKWGTAGMYTLQAANTTNALNVLDDAEDLVLNSQLSLVGMQAGQQFIIACEASYVAAPTGNSMLWCFGKNTGTASFYGLQISAGEAPSLAYRGKNSSGSSTVTMTAQSGTFASFRNQGVFACVLGVKPLDARYVDLELRLGNGTLSAYYTSTASGDMHATAGDAPPGISGGVSMANHGGLTLGSHMGAVAADNFWGNGAGNTGAIGNFAARKFNSYSATRVAKTMAFMLARKRDFPRNLCSDYT